ncbi:hypothetical protein DEIPH_ctg011orf0195 [Deinococcus phoenicis]|uniref:SARP family transcriptional regulator n=1 Tax=Deinococcus phoenicis TaxID=1476583 RepID=A0A016QT18_9DEIO|nr:hypothetical protein [Deinococcus phoenicis]EYB69203.1 hypothetical protein DEIPH_ctg011orf0195 [Deinococcus phoenicis]
MLAVHLLGHVHITQAERIVHVSSKAAALLGYLALEARPHHREHLAELLWDSPDALRNLRVELTRLKQQGVSPFPARQPMLSLSCPTDLSSWVAGAGALTERDLPGWLSLLRGPPLSGLEDLGSTNFRAWVDQQRSVIGDQLERLLMQTHARFERQGQGYAAELIRARAELLGLNFSVERSPVQAPELPFDWPGELLALREVLGQAQHAPQLVLLQGHSGSRRPMLRALVEGTAWRAVQLQSAPQRPLVQAALLQHLLRAVPPELRSPEPPPVPSQDADADLVRIAGIMVQAAMPLVVAFHDADAEQRWLPATVRFALDLPVPLVLVLSATSAHVLEELRPALGHVDRERIHHVTLPPLGVGSVMRAMRAQRADVEDDTLRARATRVVQQSEGWPRYVQALLRVDAGHRPGQAAMPGAIRDLLLVELGGLPEHIRAGLAHLAQLHDRFTPELARTLLGDAADEVLQVAVRACILVHASSHEALTFPELTYRSSDAEVHLAFANEPVRVALASLLPPAQRHAVRRLLAELLLPLQPALSRLYAERAHLPDLAEAARAALPPLPASPLRTAPIELVGEPPASAQPRHASATPNGYRVALEGGYLEVLRRGRLGPPPLLSLFFPEVPAGPWTLTARLDVLNTAPQLGMFPPPYALGLRAGSGPRQVYSAEPLPDHSDGGTSHIFGGVLPLARWFRLTGKGGGGHLEVSVRAMDVALTLAGLRWGDRTLLPFG